MRCHASSYAVQTRPAAEAASRPVKSAETDLSIAAADEENGPGDAESRQEGDDADDASNAGAAAALTDVALCCARLHLLILSPCMCLQE